MLRVLRWLTWLFDDPMWMRGCIVLGLIYTAYSFQEMLHHGTSLYAYLCLATAIIWFHSALVSHDRMNRRPHGRSNG